MGASTFGAKREGERGHLIAREVERAYVLVVQLCPPTLTSRPNLWFSDL